MYTGAPFDLVSSINLLSMLETIKNDGQPRTKVTASNFLARRRAAKYRAGAEGDGNSERRGWNPRGLPGNSGRKYFAPGDVYRGRYTGGGGSVRGKHASDR